MRRLRAVAVLALLLAAAPGAASASEVAVEVVDVLADPSGYDDVEITVTGELVGDYGRRGDVVWVQLNGDVYAREPLLSGGDLHGGNLGIGARIPAEVFDAHPLGEPGGYRHRGPLVAMTGVWRYHDPDRGGESYLDVAAITVVAAEQPLSEGVLWPALSIGAGLLAIAGVLRWRDDRRRRGGS